MTQTNEVVIFEEKKFTAVQLFTNKGADPFIDEVKKKVADFKPDISTESGRKEVASMAYKVANAKNRFDELGKKVNEDAQKQIKAVNAERKRVWEELESIQHNIRKPLTEWEEQQKYYLSQRACRGILTRVKERGVKIPQELLNFLIQKQTETT